MSKPEWGTKRSCPNCGAKYYDLNKSPIVCPKCGTEFDPDALLRSRRPRVAATAKPVKAKAAAVAVEDDVEEEVEADEDLDLEAGDEEVVEEDDELIEDASELGEDDELGEVVIDDEDKRE